jgi:hypothetical protein
MNGRQTVRWAIAGRRREPRLGHLLASLVAAIRARPEPIMSVEPVADD